MNTHLSAATLLLLAHALPAQSATSPAGFLNREGQTAFNHFVRERRFQQIDNTHVGRPLQVGSIAFRRNGGSLGGGTSAGARTFDLRILMGHASIARVTGDYDGNFLPGQRTEVYTRKSTSFPDWTGGAGTPAPFDFRAVLDVPFAYNGSDALVVDFDYTNNTFRGTLTSVDTAGSQFATAVGSGQSLGTGCPITGATRPWDLTFELHNGGPGQPRAGMRMRIEAARGPVATAAVLHLDVMDQALTVPGLCTTVRALPLVSLPVRTDPLGGIEELYFTLPWVQSFQGASLVAQLAALDPVQPVPTVLLSNGSRATMPEPRTGQGLEVAYHWSPLPVTITGISDLVWGAGMVMELAP